MTLLPEGKLYIDGKLRDAEHGAKYEDLGPWTGEVVAYAADQRIGTRRTAGQNVVER